MPLRHAFWFDDHHVRKGWFRRDETSGASYILRGLRLKAEGKSNGDGQLVASIRRTGLADGAKRLNRAWILLRRWRIQRRLLQSPISSAYTRQSNCQDQEQASQATPFAGIRGQRPLGRCRAMEYRNICSVISTLTYDLPIKVWREIGGRISKQTATNSATPSKIVTPAKKRRAQLRPFIEINGGADGIRTRDLRRDRPAF